MESHTGDNSQAKSQAEQVSTEIFQGSLDQWKVLKETFKKIGGLFSRMTDEDYEDFFPLPQRGVMVFLKNANGDIIGYTMALPINESDKLDTAQIEETNIIPHYRGRGLVGRLMTTVEDALKQRGYRYMERIATTSYGYADNIEKHYGKRITDSRLNDVGNAKFFRIQL